MMRSRIGYAVALLVVGIALAAVGTSEGATLRARRAEAAAAAAATANVAAATDPACCPKPCIAYRYRRCPDICCGCETVTKTLQVKDPCTCCPIEVTVCLPSCCEDCPAVDTHCGLLGRTVVTYAWKCGATVDVRFRNRGDVVVVVHGS